MKRQLLLVPLTALLTAALALAQFGPARVIAVPAVQREVSAGQTFVGTVVPLRTSTVGSAVPGRVEAFLVNEGDRVKKGQPLARLRTQIIAAEVAAAQGDLKMRKAELEELENGSRPEEIEQAKARLAATDAMLQMRRTKRQRTQVVGRGASPEELEEAVAQANAAEAAQLEARAALELLVKGPRKERIAQARAKVEAQQAEVERLQEQLERHTMYAPFDGYVAMEHTEVGHWVMQGSPVAEIVQLDQVDVEVGVLEDHVGYLREGTPARVEVGALPKEAFTGQVALVVPKANPRTRTLPVKVRLANRPLGNNVLIKAGMFARVTLPVGAPETAVLVPKDALVLGGATRVIYVVAPDDPKAPEKGKARAVPVELGVADGDLIQVKGDVKPGELVVVQGNERLRPGQEVVAVPPADGKQAAK
jgi:RND family efflux transporter MFP subunit